MPGLVICEALRIQVSRCGGAHSSLTAIDPASGALRQVLRRTGLGVHDVDDVVLGNCYRSGENSTIGQTVLVRVTS